MTDPAYRYTEIEVAGVDPNLPGIYEWRIEDVGVYIGQYTHVTRPRQEYVRNVARHLAGLSYRKNKPEGFRQIHRALSNAAKPGGPSVTLTLLENQPLKADRNRREAELIADRRREVARGGLPVLNSE